MRNKTTFLTALCLITALSGCAYIHPYEPTFSQGNIITQRQIALLRVGMSASQITDLLGPPLFVNVFRSNEMDYVYTLQRGERLKHYQRVILRLQGGRVADIQIAGSIPPDDVLLPRRHRLWLL